MMISVEILIPLRSNEKRLFSRKHHDAFLAFAVATCGGVTRLPGTTQGAWFEEGIVFKDECFVYLIALPSITDGGKLGQVVEFAKKHYAQRTIGIRYLGQFEVL